MSLKITPFPTASGMARAMAASAAGLHLDVKYIGVGSGLQAVQLDDAGRSIVDTLKTPAAWLEVLNVEQVDDYQKQFTIDFAGVKDTAWNFSECCLADEDKNVIAIYSNPTQALMHVSPAVDVGLVAINMVLGTFPAGSINIIHQNAPVQLFTTKPIASMHNYVARHCIAMIHDYLDRREQAKLAAEEQAVFRANVQGLLDGQTLVINQQAQTITQLREHDNQQQEIFNGHVNVAVGRLSKSIIEGVIAE